MEPERAGEGARGRTLARLVGLVALLLAVACAPARQPTDAAARADAAVILATTTSTQDSGLLDVLVPMFEQSSGRRVKTIAVGSGAALALGARGEADVVLVHAPAAEREWMAAGFGLERRAVMHNDFVLVGPPPDPAGVRGERSVLAALARIAERRATWISRDDDSGTDQLEKSLWASAGLSPRGQPWYLISGQGMGPTLTLADQKGAYTLADRGTYLARRATLQAEVHVEGDPLLRNAYHVLTVNPARFPGLAINAEGARALVSFLVAPETQRVIGKFGRERYGQALFVPDADQPNGEGG